MTRTQPTNESRTMKLATVESIREEGERMIQNMIDADAPTEAIDKIRLILEYATDANFRLELENTVAAINRM